MNEYFGEPWHAGVCIDGTRRPTPVGESCFLCNHAIAETDQGVFICVSAKDTGRGLRPAHRECALRATTGGIGHFLDHMFWCENIGDPDAGLGFRESALRVWDHLVGQGAQP